MGAYSGAARRRVHLVTVPLRPPSGHRLDSRQARHAHIPQIGLRLAIGQARHAHIPQVGLRLAVARPVMPKRIRHV